ncbi:MAG: ABC transporter ATP-binding protein [Planctomycetota bacterium]
MTLAAHDLGFAHPGQPVPAVDGVSLSAEPGRRLAIIGPNGAGKTTLLRLLAGLLSPDRGRVTIAGRRVDRLAASRRAAHAAYVPQVSTLAFPFSVGRFVAFGRHALGPDPSAVIAALEAVDLTHRADDPLGTLSQGQQQRAGLARALAQLASPAEPRVLIADEPASALDPKHRLRLGTILREQAAAGAAVVATMHDLAAAAEFDRVLLLGGSGRPVAEGPPGEVLAGGSLEAAFGVGFDVVRDDRGTIRAMVPVG